jgi:hypothetical protein
VLICFNAFNQSVLRFLPCVGSQPIELGKEYAIREGYISFYAVKFYVSDFRTLTEKGKVIKGLPRVLVNLEDSSSQSIGEIDSAAVRLDFLLGTDSLSNVSGILEGALDPINGMYWAWNSGYINIKTEGIYTDSMEKEIPFEFHLGGYLAPNATARFLSFDVNPQRGIPQLVIHMDDWLTYAFEKGIYSLMIPGKISAELATKVQASIQLTYRHE